MSTREAAPIAYPRHHITANPQNIRSKLFFRSLLSFASTSKAPKLEIYTGLGSSTEWIRIPDLLLDAFARTPLSHVRTLIFRATSHTTLALLYDMLLFMPELRALDVRDHIAWSADLPAVPDFWSSTPHTLRLESLAYEPVVGLQTLVARVIAPSADTLVEIVLQPHQEPKSVPAFPLMPRVRTLRISWPADQALQLVRQCPALAHLAISVRTSGQLDALGSVSLRLRFLDIRRRDADFGPEDAAWLVGAVTALTTLRRVVVRTGERCDAETTRPVLDVCRARRIRMRFLSGAEAYTDL